MNYQLLVTSY